MVDLARRRDNTLPVDLNTFQRTPTFLDDLLPEAIRSTLRNSPIERLAKNVGARLTNPDAPMMTVKDLNEKFKVPGREENLFSEPTTEPLAQIKFDRESANARTDAVFAKLDTFGQKAAGGAAKVLAFFSDPLNTVAFFIPGLRESRIAIAGAKFGKVAKLANQEAVVGGVGLGLIDLADQGVGLLEQKNFNFDAFLADVALGTAFGAGIGTGIGGISKLFKSKTTPLFKAADLSVSDSESLASTAAAQILGDRKVDLEHLVKIINNATDQASRIKTVKTKLESVFGPELTADIIKTPAFDDLLTSNAGIDTEKLKLILQKNFDSKGNTERVNLREPEGELLTAKATTPKEPSVTSLETEAEVQKLRTEIINEIPSDKRDAVIAQLDREQAVHTAEFKSVESDIAAQKSVIDCVNLEKA